MAPKKKMRCKKWSWSLLRVTASVDGLVFQHGKEPPFRKLPAFMFAKDTEIQVIRGGSIVDTGSVEELSGHNNGTTRFIGLVQTVPLEKREHHGSAIYFDPILSAWFKDGDVLRISKNARVLHDSLKAFREECK